MILSRITSHNPTLLTKTFELNKPTKSVAQITEAEAETIQCENIQSFNEIIKSLNKNQCLIYGIIKNSNVGDKYYITTKNNVNLLQSQFPDSSELIQARTNDSFEFASSPGILCLDYDPQPNRTILTSEELHDILIKVFPELVSCEMLIRHSTSSFIFNSETNQWFSNEKGKKIYIPIDDASRIPEIGKSIFKRLYLHDYGFIVVSKAGSLLVRGLVDESMFQQSRIDFCAGANCIHPLVQRQPTELIYKPNGSMLVTNEFKPLTPKEIKRVDDRIFNEKQSLKPTAKDQGIQHLKEKGYEYPVQIYEQLQNSLLPSGFKLLLSDNQEITVKDVLTNPDEFIGKTLYDPEEPSYNNNSQCAKIFKNNDEIVIHSFAHGSRYYKLQSHLIRVHFQPVKLHNVVKEVIGIIKETNIFFHNSSTKEFIYLEPYKGKDEIVYINKGNVDKLYNAIADHIQFYVIKKDIQIDVSIPTVVLNHLIVNAKSLKELAGVSHLPILYKENEELNWCNTLGFNENTGMLITETLKIIEKPNDKEFIEAFNRVWYAFSQYKFVNPELTNGVILSVLFNIILKNLVQTNPLIFVTASKMGSGKTKIAQMFSILNDNISVTNSYPNNDAEIEKIFFSIVKINRNTVIWDNIKEGYEISSPFLCRIATNGHSEGRLLGKNEMISCDRPILQLFTGNNILVDGDLTRRVMNIRIDSTDIDPDSKQFSFDPVEYITNNRNQILTDLITMFNAFRNAGCPVINPKKPASFPEWNTLVRQCVLFVSDKLKGLNHNVLIGDPLKALDSNKEHSPILASKKQFLFALYKNFNQKEFTTHEIVNTCIPGSDLCDSLNMLGINNEQTRNARIISKKIIGMLNEWFELHDLNTKIKIRVIKSECKNFNKTWYKLEVIRPMTQTVDSIFS